MDNKRIGFIGSGKMAGAIIKGLLKSGFTESLNIIATQSSADGIEKKSEELGVKIIVDNKELVKFSDVIFICTKPNQVLGVLEEISSHIDNSKLVVSIAAGITTSKLEKHLPEYTRIIRVMPNTPALVGEGMSGIVGGKYAKEEDLVYINSLLSTIGKCIVVDNEAQIDIVTAISGSGPAFFYKVINEIARAGEKLGMDYEKALLLSIQTAIGAGKMALNRNISMEQLISNVATKGGCTAVGVDCMNKYNSQKLFFDTIESTTKKACELGK